MQTKETRIFDPAVGFGAIRNLAEVTDATVALRNNQWWMCAAGQVIGSEQTHLLSASLPAGSPLRAEGWQLIAEPCDVTKVEILADNSGKRTWDGKGGRHCPSHVRGWDPNQEKWVERIYYAGAAEFLWGPYTIGYLEWDGRQWVDRPEPVFASTEDWEHGSVYEPNLIYADGKWKMWYASGSNQDDYIVQGYAESLDGRTGWRARRQFAEDSLKVFDFSVARAPDGYEAVYSRIWLKHTPPPPETGLWSCKASEIYPSLAQWSEPVQILNAEDKGWHTGPWKPSLQLDATQPERRMVFFDGVYRTSDPGPFPFVFTQGCLEF
jgi:hypothetical protein